MIGLKRGTVKLCEHEKEWETEAENTISRLKIILGNTIRDIQHVGSTAIPLIKAKPIIDIAVAVDCFKDILDFEKELKDNGFHYRPSAQAYIRNQLLFACGNYYEGTGDLQTHFIHVVRTNSMDWINYINFRDYLNNTPSVAKEYENLKVALALQAPVDKGREEYLRGKHDFIIYTLKKALVKSYLGKTVNIKTDIRHPCCKHKHLINYGYITNASGDEEKELNAYVLGAEAPSEEYTARIIGIIHRRNAEDVLIGVPEGCRPNPQQIAETVRFFKKLYYESEIEIYYEGANNTALLM